MHDFHLWQTEESECMKKVMKLCVISKIDIIINCVSVILLKACLVVFTSFEWRREVCGNKHVTPSSISVEHDVERSAMIGVRI